MKVQQITEMLERASEMFREKHGTEMEVHHLDLSGRGGMSDFYGVTIGGSRRGVPSVE